MLRWWSPFGWLSVVAAQSEDKMPLAILSLQVITRHFLMKGKMEVKDRFDVMRGQEVCEDSMIEVIEVREGLCRGALRDSILPTPTNANHLVSATFRLRVPDVEYPNAVRVPTLKDVLVHMLFFISLSAAITSTGSVLLVAFCTAGSWDDLARFSP